MARIVLTALGLVLASAAPAAAKECDRACTLDVGSAVLTALQSGAPGKLLTRSVRLTENGRDIRMADSQLRAIRNVTSLTTFAEPSGGVAGYNGAAEAFGGPAIFSVRVRLKGAQVAEVESLVVRRTEAAVFAPVVLADRSPVNPILPQERRQSRVGLIAIAEGFLDQMPMAAPALDAPVAACDLTENGARATQMSTCHNSVGLMGVTLVRDRRWPLVDEDRGLVWALAVGDLPNGATGQPAGRSPRRGPRSVLISALLRIEAGQVRAVEFILRDVPLGATTGWAPPKSKKAPVRATPVTN